MLFGYFVVAVADITVDIFLQYGVIRGMHPKHHKNITKAKQELSNDGVNCD